MGNRTGLGVPIVITLTNSAYKDVTTEIRQAAQNRGLKIDDFFYVGVRSRGGYLFYFGLNSYTTADDDLFDVPIGAQWDNMGNSVQLLHAKIGVRSTQAAGDKIEFFLAPEVKNA